MASSSHQRKIIVVVGATGNQGGSVARTFLSLPNWHVRCLTRNPSSAAAQKLSDTGAEIVQGDLSDPASLTRAFDSASAIFANTDFWTTYRHPDTPARAAAAKVSSSQLAFDTEVSHGTNIADAANDIPTLERFIYSALGPVKKASNGKYPHSYHWDAKATVVEYIESSQPALAAKMSVIYLGAYFTNAFLQPQWDGTKYKYVFPMGPEARLPIVDAAESTGGFVRALIEDEEPRKSLMAYDHDSYLTIPELAEMWTRVTRDECEFLHVSLEAMHKQTGLPLELLESPAFMGEFGYMYGVERVIEPADLRQTVQTRSFEEWLQGQYSEERSGRRLSMESRPIVSRSYNTCRSQCPLEIS